MKYYKAEVFLSVCLLISMALNAYQKYTNYRLEKLPLIIKNDASIFKTMEPEYPINGLKEKDIAAILDLLKSIHEFDTHGEGLLSLHVLDDNRVIINIGHIYSPMRGVGRYIGVIRTNNGWDFYDKNKIPNWVF